MSHRVVPRSKSSSAGVVGLFRGQNQVQRLFRGCSGVVPQAKSSSAAVPGLFLGRNQVTRLFRLVLVLKNLEIS